MKVCTNCREVSDNETDRCPKCGTDITGAPRYRSYEECMRAVGQAVHADVDPPMTAPQKILALTVGVLFAALAVFAALVGFRSFFGFGIIPVVFGAVTYFIWFMNLFKVKRSFRMSFRYQLRRGAEPTRYAIIMRKVSAWVALAFGVGVCIAVLVLCGGGGAFAG